jgi:UV DNA damage repair endonuclease
MRTIREYNPYLANKSREEVREMIRRLAYDSSVFEGVKLPDDHPAVILSKASRAKSAKPRGTKH